MSRLTRDGTAEPVSRDQILRRERGQRNIHFPCSADHVQDWQPYPVDPYSCYICVTIHTYIRSKSFLSSFSPELVIAHVHACVPHVLVLHVLIIMHACNNV